MMTEDRITALLDDAVRSPLPARLEAMQADVMDRAVAIGAGQRRLATVNGGLVIAALAMTVGVFGAIAPGLPGRAADGAAYDPGMALAPSTLLGARG